MPFCKSCATLSVQDLAFMALQETKTGLEEFPTMWLDFPKDKFHKHHASFDELERFALRGCDLCRLILDLSKGYDITVDPPRWRSDCEVSNSMYTAAKALKASDIKIALSSSYFNVGTTIEQAPILDTLFVQIGPRSEDYSDDGDDENDEWIRPLPLMISLPRTSLVVTRNVQIGRFQTSAHLGSTENFDLARSWLKECNQTCRDCLIGDVPVLPTRVLDVGTKNDTKSPRVIHSRGEKAEYTALSHCWGGEITPLLTTTTLASFGQLLPYDALPANFRDAITITRELGIRYLWIDSLCIIQDSPQDWNEESKKMGAVYGNSTLTISAMASSGSTAGILRPDIAEKFDTPRSVNLTLLTENGSPVTGTVEWEGADTETLATLEHKSPLSSRAWTFQEAILSPRRLVYGKRRIYWACRGVFKSAAAAFGFTQGRNAPEINYANALSVYHSAVLRKRPQSQVPPSAMILHDYYWLIRNYSVRALTFSSDKLPAFSGLAQRLHHIIGGDYLAGIWSSDIKNGLLWKSDVGYCTHVKRPYRAPSWSWAVTDGGVCIDYVEDQPADDRSLDMRLLEYHVTSKDKTNPFGQVEHAYLVITGLVQALVRTRQILTYKLTNDPGVGYGSFDEPLVSGLSDRELNEMGYSSFTELYQITRGSREDTYILAISQRLAWDDEQKTSEVCVADFLEEEECLALLVRYVRRWSSPVEGDIEEEDNSKAECLALRRVAGRGSGDVYERIGMLTMIEFDHEWLRSWESQTLTII